ncbi:MAG: type II CAAX endopeptidase family protein [Acutalibacteraceae bacterium]|nr:type II CAAX endopeptidase family protein [Acutalibacteraceae bacterium]
MFFPTEYYNEELIKRQKIREEKRKIRKSSNLLGVAFFIMTAFMVLWSIPLGILTAVGVIHPNRLNDILNDSTIMQVVQVLLSSFAFILSYIIYVKLEKENISKISSFKKADRPDLVVPYVLVGLGVCGLSNFLTSMAGAVFQSLGFEYELDLMENPTNLFGVILVFISTAITPALVEEFAIRGAVMGNLRKYGDGFAIITSAFIFGIMHGNFVQIPFAFIMGLFFGFAVIKTGTIWTAIIIHFINNFISVVLDYATKGLTATTNGVINMLYLVILLFVGFVGMVMLSRKQETDFSLENNGMLTVPQKLGVFFSSPLIIIATVVVVLEALFLYA